MASPAGELLRTERLRLRDWTTSPSDVARLVDIYGRDEVTRWIGGPPKVPPPPLPAPRGAGHAPDERLGCRAVGRPGGGVAGTGLFQAPPPGGGGGGGGGARPPPPP